MKFKIVGKALKPGSFPDRYDARFVGMDRAHGLKRSPIVAGARAQRRTLTIPV